MVYKLQIHKKLFVIAQLFLLLNVVSIDFAYSYQSDVRQLKAFSNAFVEVAKEVTPAVVSITATKNISLSQMHERRESGELDDFFRRFFPQDDEFSQQGLGSGVLIDKAGYILTNNHVIQDASKLEVRLLDKRRFDAEIVGADPLTDVALIKIEGENLPYARLGNSEQVQIGEWVMAIGTPFGEMLNSTVTAGIVSAIGRNLGIINRRDTNSSYKIEDFIQTDAAINPGNSGGPLINLDGEVIGINTAILSNTGSYQGYGFAIPINLAKNITNDLRVFGTVKRGIIGISFQEIQDQNEMERYQLDNPYGLVIRDFTLGEDSPGKRAGLQKDDVIIAVNDNPIARSGQLQTIVASKKPGDKIKLTYIRGGKVNNVVVTLGDMPSAPAPVLVSGRLSFPEIGLGVSESPQTQERISDEPNGVVVTRVLRNSVAFNNDIKLGDIIYKIEKTEIHGMSDFTESVEQYRNQSSIVLYIRNNEGHQLINLRIDQ